MRIVVDTNVVISGVFFGGRPRQVLMSVVKGEVSAFATVEIVDEYQEVVEELEKKGQGFLEEALLSDFEASLRLLEPVMQVEVCRDPDDDKFLGCALDSRSGHIVSGDKDLLTIGSLGETTIITASEFCEKYLD